MITATAGYGVLGLALHEAVRVYRSIQNNQSIVPKIGIGKRNALLVYILVMIVFAVFSVLATDIFTDGSPKNAIYFGFGIPLATQFIRPEPPSNEVMDDLFSEESNTTFADRLKHWLRLYNVI